jgi:hypothetical protein
MIFYGNMEFNSALKNPEPPNLAIIGHHNLEKPIEFQSIKI